MFGLVMLAAEKYATRIHQKTKLEKTEPKQALTMGFAQALAVVPGVSRSGSTITAGLFMGMDRIAATRFSFLLGVPIIAGAAAKVLLGGTALHQINSEPGVFFAGILTAFLAGMLAIKFLLAYLANHSLAAFAYYRIGLAVIVCLVLLIH
jgi:undecaprenyl-diphosphatase